MRRQSQWVETVVVCAAPIWISKWHHWFKSIGDFAEWVELAYWWSWIGKGLQSMGLPRLFFFYIRVVLSSTRIQTTGYYVKWFVLQNIDAI